MQGPEPAFPTHLAVSLLCVVLCAAGCNSRGLPHEADDGHAAPDVGDVGRDAQSRGDGGESLLERARANLRACFGDSDACARYPGTSCLCATDASDPACDFRTAEETDYQIADEEGGNECIAACVADATCEQLRSQRGCFAECAMQHCGPYRPIVSWQACSTSEAVADCLEQNDCADPPPDDWIGELGQDPPGALETCFDGCQTYFRPAGCLNTRECEEGSACLERAPNIDVGVCTPVDGPVVTTAEVDPTPFATGCTTSSDCVLAEARYDCACGHDGCGHVGVLAARIGDYETAFDAAKASCTADLLCAPVDGDCFDEGDRAACVDSACIVVDDSNACVSDDECIADKPYLDPNAARCVAVSAGDRLLFLTCAECMYETSAGVQTSPTLNECPSSYFCNTMNTCQPFVACQTTSDCAGEMIPETPNLVCKDNLCQPCTVDADCEGGKVCVADAPPLPGPDEVGTWGARNGCWAADSDVECLDATCPRPCQQQDDKWVCP